MSKHVADEINSKTKTMNEAGEVFAVDHFHVDHKTKGVININNNETQITNNVSNVEIKMVQIIYNLVRPKTNFVQNAQNADFLQKFVVSQTSTI